MRKFFGSTWFGFAPPDGCDSAVGGGTKKLSANRVDEVKKRRNISSKRVRWRVGRNTTSWCWIAERGCVRRVADKWQQSSRPLVVAGEPLEELLEAVLDTTFDTANEQQSLGDFLDCLLDVIRGVTIPTGEEKIRGFGVFLPRAPDRRELVSQRS